MNKITGIYEEPCLCDQWSTSFSQDEKFDMHKITEMGNKHFPCAKYPK